MSYSPYQKSRKSVLSHYQQKVDSLRQQLSHASSRLEASNISAALDEAEDELKYYTKYYDNISEDDYNKDYERSYQQTMREDFPNDWY